MRTLGILLVLAAMALQATAAAVRVTVEQLERALATMQGKSDGQVAEQLSDFQLTERLSEVRIARLEADMPGTRARKALMLLADASAFLDLPASDVRSRPAPEPAEQVALLTRARNYVALTVMKLPNFFATRETTSFVSTQANPNVNSMNTIKYVPFQEVDNSSVTVLYRDGHELVAKGQKYRASAKEVRTRGEFGPILVVVLNDASKGSVVWSHWEQGVSRVQAVFRYTVPQPASHYLVTSPGLRQETQYYPAYHGEIALDPTIGSILRLTVVAEVKPGDPMASADLMVDYRSMEIGGISYICPEKSVALSEVRILNRELDDKWNVELSSLGPPQTYLNEVLFTHYHLFRAEARILAGNSQEPEIDHSPSVPASALYAAPATVPQLEAAKEVPLQGVGTRFTVKDLEQALALDKTYGTPDEDVVKHLSKVQLTERLSDTRLARLEAYLPSPAVRQALDMLADVSAFLYLPDADIQAKPAPDLAAQASMLALAANYAKKAVLRLPNFSVTQKTTRFEDTPAGKKDNYEPLHKVGSSTLTVDYRDGHESVDDGKKHKDSSQGTTDAGVFGPILARVLADAAKGAMEWSHWEQGATGLEAVFSYQVPKESSHYPLSASLNASKGMADASRPTEDIHDNPAYHGEIALNPANGSVLRLTVVADVMPSLAAGDAFLVEYGPSEIEDGGYICPVKTVTVSQVRIVHPGSKDLRDEPSFRDTRTYLNDTVFRNYRPLREGTPTHDDAGK